MNPKLFTLILSLSIIAGGVTLISLDSESSEGASTIVFTYPGTVELDYGSMDPHVIKLGQNDISGDVGNAFWLHFEYGYGSYNDNFPSWIIGEFKNNAITITIYPGHKVDQNFGMWVDIGSERYIIQFHLIVAEEGDPNWGGEIPGPDPEPGPDDKLNIPIKGVFDILYELFTNLEMLAITCGGLITVAILFRTIRSRGAV